MRIFQYPKWQNLKIVQLEENIRFTYLYAACTIGMFFILKSDWNILINVE